MFLVLKSKKSFLAIIGPWIKSDHDDKQYNLTKFHLVEKNMAIEITTKGLYLISVQVCAENNDILLNDT
jgi:hypothetical protein